MAFNLTEYIKRNLVNGYLDGTWTESKIAQLCVGYLDKGHLTVENITEIDAQIQAIKDNKQSEVEISDGNEIESRLLLIEGE